MEPIPPHPRVQACKYIRGGCGSHFNQVCKQAKHIAGLRRLQHICQRIPSAQCCCLRTTNQMHIPTTKEENLCKLPKCTLLLPKLLYLKTPSKIYYELKQPPQDKKTDSRRGGKKTLSTKMHIPTTRRTKFANFQTGHYYRPKTMNKTTPTTTTTYFRRCIHTENT